jgi:mono/diheme cytochrome c family protein
MSVGLASAAALTTVATLAACGGRSVSAANLFSQGRAVFVSAGCGGCHTVASAGTHGHVGPDFDTSERLTRAHIQREVLYGEDGMPSFHGRISHEQETAVVDFVFQTLHRRARAR